MYKLRQAGVLGTLALAGALALAACQSTPVEARLASSCEVYSATLSTLADYRSELTPSQDQTVEAVVEVVDPICTAGGSIDSYSDALLKVSEGIRNLARIEGAVGVETQE